ncbi:MAG: hypothetical protein WBP26_05030 [Candidatus Saccharimonadales bacterium]
MRIDNRYWHALLSKKMTRRQFIVACLLIIASLVGITALLRQLKLVAATESTADFEAENGTLANGATKVTDSTAAGGSAVKFASTNARDALVSQYGTYIPQAGLTANQVGITVPISELGTVPGNTPDTVDFPITSPVTWENKIIYGRLLITGGGRITARNCWFAGPPSNPPSTGETAVLDFNNPGTSGSTFLDCTIAPRFPHPRLNGFKGSRHKVERCHIFWVTDGLGPYTSPGRTYATDVEVVASRIERLVYWPGAYYANRSPYYWDGSTWPDGSTAGKVVRTAADKNLPDMIDTVHNDGNHNDCIEIHNAFGTHTFDAATKKWSGDGIHIWGNALYADDAYGQNSDPSGAGIPVPGMAGSVAGSSFGWGDNPRRGLVGGGQKPGMAMPQTSWTSPMSTNPTKYAANGAALYIGHVTNVQFESPTSVVVHDNYINGGNMGMQEQRKSIATITFQFYDNKFGPDYYMWSGDRNIYPVRINDFIKGSNLSASGDTITHSGNLLSNGDRIRFTTTGRNAADQPITTINTTTNYYVVGRTSSTFKVSATQNGGAITIGTATGIEYSGANIMPNWSSGPVRIPNHPVTGAPPFGSGASNKWADPGNKWGKNGQPLDLGSSTVAGIRVA